MSDLQESMSYIDGDPQILPYSAISNADPGRPNFACGQIKNEHGFWQGVEQFSIRQQIQNLS